MSARDLSTLKHSSKKRNNETNCGFPFDLNDFYSTLHFVYTKHSQHHEIYWYFLQTFPSICANTHFNVILLTNQIDIGANLTDGMFQGIYNGSQKHPNDLDIILDRSWANGLDKIIITVGTINDTEDAVKIAQKDGMRSRYST